MRLRTGLFLAALLCLTPAVSTAANAALQASEEQYVLGQVEEILSVEQEGTGELERTVQTLRLRIQTENDSNGITRVMQYGIGAGGGNKPLREGQAMVVQVLQDAQGNTSYLLREPYRLPGIITITLVFIGLTFLLGGWTSLRALIGLGVSIAVLAAVVMPAILRGTDPLLASLGGAVLIAGTSIYVAHGLSRKTTVAVVSTVVTLLLSTVAAVVAVQVTQLFGLGSEEAMFLLTGPLQGIDLRGLLLGGIIIGALGVLDDITTAQAAAIHEIRQANPNLSRKHLYQAGTSIGREHIASLINTLALAYVGSSLPLLLLFTTGSTTPIWITLNSEFLAEEIVRTLAGSLSLLLAVPITTRLGVWWLHGDASDGSPHLHGHVH